MPEDACQESIEVDTSEYVFDVEFMQDPGFDDEENGMTFRLTGPRDDIYLTLYNCHNGYYSHGFEFKSGEKLIHKGSL